MQPDRNFFDVKVASLSREDGDPLQKDNLVTGAQLG